MMISPERINTYLMSLGRDLPDWLEALYRKAAGERVPVLRPESRDLLITVLKLRMPSNILEVGTAVGFSALLMAYYTEPSCRIRTIEIDPESAEKERLNIKNAGMDGRITVICGDAAEVLKKTEPAFDLIFMDAAKGQYIHFLPEVKRLMKDGSVLVSDNIFQEGDVLDSRFLIERRDRTIHKRMREYLYALTHDEELYTSLIPAGDGLALSVMRR